MPTSDASSRRRNGLDPGRRTMKRLLMTLGALLALAGCGDTIHGTEYAEPTVAEFRDMMNAGQFEKIYDSAAPEFREAISREDSVALFSAVNRKLGKLE